MSGSARRVILVDDDLGMRETLADVLRVKGYHVEAAASGRDALKQLAADPFDVAVVDIKLPDISGLGLLEEIKRTSPRTEVVFVTAFASVATATQAVNGAAFAYVTKPFEMDQLLATLRRAAEKVEMAEARRVADDALRESEERFRATFEQAAVGIAHIGEDGAFIRVNQRLCDIYGFTREEMLGRTFKELVDPEDLDDILELRRRMFANKIPMYTAEVRCRHKNGATVWVGVTASAVRDGTGEPKYSIGAIQDITERKRLEQELLHSQRMEGVGQLAGGIAHDFNNLLTVISGRSELLLDQLDAADPIRRELDLIYKTTGRAAALTRQLLAFSRKQVFQSKVLDLNELVQGATALLKRIIGEHVELVFIPAAGLGRVRVDPSQLEQVVVNLAVNARDAMPDGGKLTIGTANTALDERYAREHVGVHPGPYVQLTVSDTGVGMDAATRARIFEPFFTTKGPGKGTGLGLSTVYGIVKQSGGHIRVYSEPGRGTTLKVYLPQTDRERETVPDPGAGMPAGTETILVVEDEAEVRALAHEILEGLGYTVVVASTATDALLIAQRQVGLIDLLLTDVVMPRMSGRALAETLGEMRPEMKVLFMSGYTDDAIIRHGVLEEGVAFLEKPFTAAALARKVRAVLDATAE